MASPGGHGRSLGHICPRIAHAATFCEPDGGRPAPPRPAPPFPAPGRAPGPRPGAGGPDPRRRPARRPRRRGDSDDSGPRHLPNSPSVRRVSAARSFSIRNRTERTPTTPS
ncbi:hypothetical protein EF911_19880 [Streptomyces sp. WAC06128]|nr:hypothetical protein EF911_19880 [Streptomyces sp. WAC06128]